jgi:hypothetical protein
MNTKLGPFGTSNLATQYAVAYVAEHAGHYFLVHECNRWYVLHWTD